MKNKTVVVTKPQRAKPFVPHNFKTELFLLREPLRPIIFIPPNVYADKLAIAQQTDEDEIGWLGTVKELGDERYLIDSSHMIKMLVGPSTQIFTEDGLGEYFTELAQKDIDACSRMLFWGHLHDGNSTSPSQQDEDQMKWFDHNDYFIRGIFGREGRAEFTFFDYKKGIRWNDVPWMIYVPEVNNPIDKERERKWANEVNAKVEKIPVPEEIDEEETFDWFQQARLFAGPKRRGKNGGCRTR